MRLAGVMLKQMGWELNTLSDNAWAVMARAYEAL